MIHQALLGDYIILYSNFLPYQYVYCKSIVCCRKTPEVRVILMDIKKQSKTKNTIRYDQRHHMLSEIRHIMRY